MGCCLSAVAYLLERANYPARRTNTPDKWNARKAEIEFLYHKMDMSQDQIAEYFGAQQAMITRVMKRLNIPRLSTGRRKGRTHPEYKDGKSSRLYRTVITRDKCHRCGMTENLGIHHKNDDHYDNHLENLEVLCNSCHLSITKKKWWAAKKAGNQTPKSNAPLGWKRKCNVI